MVFCLKVRFFCLSGDPRGGRIQSITGTERCSGLYFDVARCTATAVFADVELDQRREELNDYLPSDNGVYSTNDGKSTSVTRLLYLFHDIPIPTFHIFSVFK